MALATGSPVRAGDLLVVACDDEAAGGTISLGSSAPVYSPRQIGPSAVPAPLASDGLEAQIFYGTVLQAPGGSGILSLTATSANATTFMDCSANVYRGGSAPVSLVDSIAQSGGDTGFLDAVSCGPVDTEPGGVALYVAVIYDCAGPPTDSGFTQRSGIDGNPDGDVAPTDGSSVSTPLQTCGGSTGYWVCLTASFSP